MPANAVWYYAQEGKSVGPMTLEELLRKLPEVGGQEAMVYGPTTANWIEARHVPTIVDALRGPARPSLPVRVVPTRSTTRSTARKCSTSKSRSIQAKW
jgi:hypothetical protein